MTEDQIEKLRNERVALAHMRAQERKSKSLWLRLKEWEDKTLLLSTAKAGQIGHDTARQKAESKEPPAPQGIDWTNDRARIEAALEHAEDALDVELGLSPARDFKTMTTSELDAELMKWRGVASHEVCVRAKWLGGTPRTIENARARMGVSRTYGLPLEDEKAA